MNSLNRKICISAIAFLLIALLSLSCSNTATDAHHAGGEKKPNVLFITIDTFRADYLFSIGGGTQFTHNMDAVAARGALFTRCVTPENLTGPSVAAIMTSRLPYSSGIIFNPQRIPDSLPTLAETLRRAGYETTGIAGTSLVASGYNFNKGFDHFYDEFNRSEKAFNYNRTADSLNEDFFEWLDLRDGSKPFFAWLHYFDPHFPYHARYGVFAGETFSYEYLRDLYWKQDVETIKNEIGRIILFYNQELMYTDRHIGAILKELTTRGEMADTLVVITGDHGEELFQHDYFYGHGRSLYNNVLNVPLIIAPPGRQFAGVRVDSVVKTIDIMPTVLDLLDIPAPGGIEGRSLLPLMRGEQFDERPVFSIRDPRDETYWEGTAAAMTSGPWKYIHFKKAKDRLFNLEFDPFEHNNLIDTDPERAKNMMDQIRKNIFESENFDPAAKPGFTRKEQKMLKELGYIH